MTWPLKLFCRPKGTWPDGTSGSNQYKRTEVLEYPCGAGYPEVCNELKGTVMKFVILRYTAFAFLSATAVVFSTPQSADAREWNMCDWEEIPRHILKRIAQRPDFEDIIERMTFHCPDTVVAFISATPAIVSQDAPALGLRAVATDVDVEDGWSLASTAGATDAETGGASTSAGDTATSGASSEGGTTGENAGSSDSGTSSDRDSSSGGETSSDSGGGRGSNANNGGGNGSEGASPGKGKGANIDE